jgi:hypothetical protein
LTQVNGSMRLTLDIAAKAMFAVEFGGDMKQSNLTPQRLRTTRRTAGHAQQDHILDPYQAQQKLHESTICPRCNAVYHDGRWQWVVKGKTLAKSYVQPADGSTINFPPALSRCTAISPASTKTK